MDYAALASTRLSAKDVVQRYFEGDPEEAEHVARRIQSQFHSPAFWVTEFLGPRTGWRDLLTWRPAR